MFFASSTSPSGRHCLVALTPSWDLVGPRRSSPNSALGRAARTKQTVHIADVLTERGFFETPPGFPGPQLSMLAGARTLVAVPMLKESELIGAIVIYRQQAQPFRRVGRIQRNADNSDRHNHAR